ncbi:DNA (cytosine-5-)-methyltransferase [Bosea sp. PAMC 26642]|uniref:DNA (cytosine-5-)-methyltransferase n=1 Tax=Bosea sp. (strain PAMC 26642) TaxID=1792307 RepID=UPI0007705722|nr:DNA (cytosine-5-)-methyltransferase [Bosea sp. PAMC 26642]AMJ59012.1 DNA cytosine methyltransferase [Bosea sp. PAMC 26642]
MSAEKPFALWLRQSGITAETAPDELGYSWKQIRRYAAGEAPVPKLVMERVRTLARARLSERPVAKFRFIDLFAGIGGLRLGFDSIGGRCVFTSEWDRWSSRTYAANFLDGDDHVFAGDIRPYGDNPSLVPAHDVLLAGFPCQPFSLAGVCKKNSLGRAHGFDDEKQGNLFFFIRDILKHHKPAAFLLENVKHLERHNGRRTFAVIRDILENELGYRIDFRVISSEPWVPQKRERIFIVGFREDVGFSFGGFDRMIPKPTTWPKLDSILQPHNEVDDKYTLSPKLWQYLQDYRVKHKKAGNGFGYSLFGPDRVTRTLSARYHKDGSEILIDQKPRPRRLTPTECARLMGFEYVTAEGDHCRVREWTIPPEVSDTQAYRQFGNAVVVPVIEAIARYIEPSLCEALARGRAREAMKAVA